MEKKEVLEFLKELQKEMKEQDTDCQASPRYWGIIETKVEPAYEGCGDEVLYCTENESKITTVEEAKEEALNYIKDEYSTVEDFLKEKDIFESDLEFSYLYEFALFMGEYFDLRYDEYNEQEVSRVVEGPIFLTKRECKEHIEKNHYHYNNPRSYAMTSWRSPQLTKLWDILENFDWEELNEDECNNKGN